MRDEQRNNCSIATNVAKFGGSAAFSMTDIHHPKLLHVWADVVYAQIFSPGRSQALGEENVS